MAENDPIRELLRSRFWKKVERGKSDTCWEWHGALCNTGYGIIVMPGERTALGNPRLALAHRVSWWLEFGVRPDADLYVCHHCDNRRCINPSHLFLGTQDDNMKDALRKGRIARGRQISDHLKPSSIAAARARIIKLNAAGLMANPGARNGRAILSEENVRAIRESHTSGIRNADLARKYGVTPTTIAGIVRRRLWRHIA